MKGCGEKVKNYFDKRINLGVICGSKEGIFCLRCLDRDNSLPESSEVKNG